MQNKNVCAILCSMDPVEKLAISSRETTFEAEGLPLTARTNGLTGGLRPASISRRFGDADKVHRVRSDGHDFHIHLAASGSGRQLPLLKAMLTSACERNCKYCPFRAGRDFRRVTFQPQELAHTFFAAHRSGLVEGLFLSTGIFAGGANTQNKLLETAEILRKKLSYRGYLHLKIMPGAERGQVLRAMKLADRVSTNLEAPNASCLYKIAPQKAFEEELLSPLRWAQEIRQTLPAHLGWRGRWPTTTTQFVVGPAGETDLELLSTVDSLYQQTGLQRAYFETFSPVEGTPMENHPPEDPQRKVRLYQASFLLRDYGFNLEELPFMSTGNLPKERDPKTAFADQVIRGNPIEVNSADRRALMRVPGIGPRGADQILKARRSTNIRELGQLRRFGILTERAAPYITLDGSAPSRQLTLF
ncbi:MAG TPA: radical SAM protein [Anaerolineales bacterium]|nr:radical SAM protein [Anaerolineales bacterium]